MKTLFFTTVFPGLVISNKWVNTDGPVGPFSHNGS